LTDLPRYDRRDDPLASAIWADTQQPLPNPPQR
jgi:hypothetical protein